MNKAIIFSMLLAVASPAIMADNDYDDDIYYNPKKSEKASKKSNYIKNYDQIDVDTYNRRGQYYITPIDTIGDGVGMGEDFVYTQQIQKYINPTIVVDNADILADLLENSYGNVEIVLDNGVPTFAPVYTYPLYPRYYYNWGPSWTWNWAWGGPGWGISIGYDPWYTGWGWGWNSWWSPSWAWGGPGWGWGPAWGGPGWRPRPNPGFYAHNWRPEGRRVNNPGTNWAGGGHRTSAPGYNYNGGHRGTTAGVMGSSGSSNMNIGGHRTGSSMNAASRPGFTNGSHVGTSQMGGTSVRPGNNGHRPVNGSVSGGNGRVNGSAVGGSSTTTNTNKAGGYNYNSGSNRNSGLNRNSGSSYNSGSSRSSSPTRSSGSYNSGSHRSSGGSMGTGGGRSSGGGRSGGGGGGRHR